VKRPELRYQDGDKLAAELKAAIHAVAPVTGADSAPPQAASAGGDFLDTRPASKPDFQQTVIQKASPRQDGADAADIEI
jgi:hypothetical protein